MPKTTGLGRGLASLIPGPEAAPSSAPTGLFQVAVSEIRANPHQPRLKRGVEDMKLEELADSIREHGILQPLIVTRTDGPGAPYTLIAGERRWRAAQLAKLTHVPVLVKEAAPQQMLELALIENLQRSDLNPLEEAAAYQQLINEFGLTQEHVAERVGKSRVAITNMVRLLKLPGQIQAALAQGAISEGHARALLGLGSAVEQQAMLDTIMKKGLNVRQTEDLVRRTTEPTAAARPVPRPSAKQWEGARQYEDKLRTRLGTKVSLQHGRKGGRIVIEFYSEEEFASIYEKLVGNE